MRPATLACLIALLTTHPAGAAEVMLISHNLELTRAQLVSIEHGKMTIIDAAQRKTTIDRQQLLGFALPETQVRDPEAGLVILADGQRLPGHAIETEDNQEDVLAWRHPWLGRMQLPLEDIASVCFQTDFALLQPTDADAVLLANGDLLEGFIASLSDPILLEAQAGRLLEIPRRNVAAVRMVNPPVRSSQTRAWLADGTIVDVRDIRIDESGHVRLTTTWHAPDAAPARLMLNELAAMLLNASQLVPFAQIPAQDVQGPVTRYVVPQPRVLEDSAVLGLSRIEFHGPLTARYLLPQGAARFAAEAVLPESARAWGDYELLISDRNGERFRQRMHANDPLATINIDLPDGDGGTELIIELREGNYTGIQDHLILRWPMILLHNE